MGRQIQFNALPADMQAFLDFVYEHDPVIVAVRDSDSPDVTSVVDPALETNTMTLWNQSLVPTLKRRHITVSGRDYYAVDSALPVLEFSPSRLCEWNGRHALLAGRVYGALEKTDAPYERWYNALARWIRARFVRSSMPLVPYVGPAAFDWYKQGGVLLPMMIPPALTQSWNSWLEAQDQHRRVFSR